MAKAPCFPPPRVRKGLKACLGGLPGGGGGVGRRRLPLFGLTPLSLSLSLPLRASIQPPPTSAASPTAPAVPMKNMVCPCPARIPPPLAEAAEAAAPPVAPNPPTAPEGLGVVLEEADELTAKVGVVAGVTPPPRKEVLLVVLGDAPMDKEGLGVPVEEALSDLVEVVDGEAPQLNEAVGEGVEVPDAPAVEGEAPVLKLPPV